MASSATEPVGGLYRFLRSLVRAFYIVFFRVRQEGIENIPETGAVVLCSNHISSLDPPALGSLIHRQVFFMAKVELFSYLGWVLPAIGTFPVDRDARDMKAVRQVLRLTRQGRIVALYPEGHRYRDGRLGPPRPGAGLLAQRSGATIIPVAMCGPWRLFGRVLVRFGKPLDLSQSEDPASEIMQAIADLYYGPEGGRSGHPWARSN